MRRSCGWLLGAPAAMRRRRTHTEGPVVRGSHIYTWSRLQNTQPLALAHVIMSQRRAAAATAASCTGLNINMGEPAAYIVTQMGGKRDRKET